MIPICSYCNKIRDDKGIWEKIELYLHKYSRGLASFTHGICPECYQEELNKIRAMKIQEQQMG